MRLIIATAFSTLILIGGGLIFAESVDKQSKYAWLERAQDEGADLTETFALTIERATSRLYAFSRGLEGNRVATTEDFIAEARRMGILVGEAPFRAVAFAVRVKTEDRPALESQLGKRFTVVGEPSQRAPERSESYVVVGIAGVGDLLQLGTDLATERVLSSLAVDGFHSPAARLVGPSVEGRDGGLFTPISVRSRWGDRDGIVIGLFDYRDAIQTITRVSLPDGIGIEVSERAAAIGDTVFRPIFSIQDAGDAVSEYTTRYSQTGVGWRFLWTIHESYGGGPDRKLGTASRWGGVAAAVLTFLILALTELTRRRDKALNQRSDLLQTMIDCMEEGITIISPDGKLVTGNQRFFDFYGYPNELRREGVTIAEFLKTRVERGDFGTVEDPVRLITERSAMLTAGTARNMVEELPDGRAIDIRRSRTEDGHLVSLYLDITESRRNEVILRDQANVMSAALDNMHNGLLLVSGAGRLLVWNDRLEQVLGLPEGRLIVGAEAWPVLAEIPLVAHQRDDQDLPETLSHFLRAVADGRAEPGTVQLDGARWVAVAFHRMPDGGLVYTFTDETARKFAEDKLMYNALYDAVTGLPNRALFLDRIGQMLNHWKPEDGVSFAVLFLDLDRFKNVNDSLGHEMGDILLVEVARRLERAIGAGDTAARLAGDEFGVLLTNVRERDDVMDAVHWLQADMAAAFPLADQEVFTSVSIGISLPSDQFKGAEDMLRAADIAMYRAKDLGLGSQAIFDPQMQTRAITQLQLESDLRRAVERDEIIVHFQPLIDLRTGRIAGFESLARWDSPDRGIVRPGQFIPLAEDTGLVVQIGAIALNRALRQMREWRRTLGAKAPDLISVNLSARQLQDPELVREIELQLAQANVPGSCLKLEVTESMIMRNPEQTARMLLELKQLGVALSIDDFGTGYSSLSYLHRFPFDTLKVDRSFVLSMQSKHESHEIIRTIALLAHTLEMDVIAEGIETEAQRKELVEFGCEYGQGFFFAKPMDAAAATELLKEGKQWSVGGTPSTKRLDASTDAAE